VLGSGSASNAGLRYHRPGQESAASVDVPMSTAARRGAGGLSRICAVVVRERRDEMKALSVWQPHASLIAIGAKAIETRSWYTKYRGPLAIHASVKLMREQWRMCMHEPFRSALTGAKLLFLDGHGIKDLLIIPTGAVITTCNLVDVRYMLQGKLYRYENGAVIAGGEIPMPGEPELSFGDYTPGRFAWILKDVQKLPEPIPAKGQQGLWTVPPEIEVIITNEQGL